MSLPDFPQPDEAARSAVAARAADALRPADALRRFDEVAAWLAGWQRTTTPHVDAPSVVVFVGDHGVTAEGVSAYPSAVTAEVLRALREGAATANVMAAALGASFEVVDVGVGRPSGNIMLEPALSADRFGECFEAGRRAVVSLETDLLVCGEMGIGNTTAASAVCAALYGGPADVWTGRGTGIDDETYERKLDVVDAASKRVARLSDPLEILRETGGAELVAIAGAVTEARVRSVPVVLDGFVVTAAVAPLEEARPGALEHCIAGHRSAEPGHALLLEKLGKDPLLDLDLRLGEGSGALAAVPLIKLAAACVTEVATFQEWGLQR
ncbi:MAG TPA: nicotinate-nucleotide--dimethylbenzimidazole phosphoribosyltransferase [Actinomycetota bacterium]|nr:nicotinate-nucleotide--dimethylbenzimidazole phosphoribosyltransferase [Actinomycetota bacterium]